MLLALEAPRAVGELGLLAAWSPLLASSPRGDGHTRPRPAGARSERCVDAPLRRFLKALGYDVHGWRLGRNEGPTTRMLDGVGERFLDLHGRRGEGVSIVGWSMGGIFARRLAHSNPDSVRQVITLGSPFRMMSDIGSSALHVPSTSVYSRTDGIAPWKSCFDGFGPRHEAVEVIGIALRPRSPSRGAPPRRRTPRTTIGGLAAVRATGSVAAVVSGRPRRCYGLTDVDEFVASYNSSKLACRQSA